jgi:tetratricopeptide (TPR) repeat protein
MRPVAEAVIENPRPPLSQVWQLPVLAGSLILFGFGLYMAAPRAQPPDYVGPLDAAEARLKAEQYGESLKLLEAAEPNATFMPRPLQARMKLLEADAVSLGAAKEGWHKASNHKEVVANYLAAEKLGVKLGEPQVRRLAESYAALGEVEQALEMLAKLGEGGAIGRQDLLKAAVMATIGESPLLPERVTQSIERLRVEPGLLRANAIWCAAREGQLLLMQKKPAVDLLLRRYAQLKNAVEEKADTALAELMLALGKAYLAESDSKNAERWLLKAREAFAPTDPLNGDTLVALGRIRFEEGSPAESVELFSQVVARFTSTPAYTEAMIGKADSNARLDDMEKAIEDYEAAVGLVLEPKCPAELRAHLIDSLQTQGDLRFGRGEYDLTLRFISLQQRLYTPPLPAELLGRFAVTHERSARKLLGVADGEPDGEQHWKKLDGETRIKAAGEYGAAAEAFRMHAESVKGRDDAAYASSLWKSADFFDKSGQHKQAIAAFTEYVQARPADPRRLEGIYRLAQSHQADGQYDPAIELYQRLLDDAPKSREAYSSLVPLARCLVAKGPKFIDRAEHVLLSIVTDNEVLRPESREYREALVELGQLYYHRAEEGDFEKAIDRLNEVVKRYGGTLGESELPELLFQLGDAHRKSVEQMDRKLAGSLPPSQRAAMVAERAKRLDAAREDFDAVIITYEGQDPKTLAELPQLYLRNSYFYRADCAYDLRQFEGPDGSVELYNKALQRYEKHPSALVALVQIVNSYSELGQWDKARATNERAKEVLKRIPDGAFEDPTLPMSRQHWQRWLDWSSQLTSADPRTP